MKYRRLGKSALNISCLGLGGNIFGHFCDENETKRIVSSAYDFGINFIDTADVYSNGDSEEIIGNAIKNNRSKWVVATKVGVRSGEDPKGKGRKKYIINALDKSLNRFGMDYIDLYQMHHFDPETPYEETLEALNELVKSGKVRSIGVSNYSGNQLKSIASMGSIKSFIPISSTQNHYNILKRKVEEDLFPVCNKFSIGFIVYGGLARGILAGKYSSMQNIPSNSRAFFSNNVKNDLNQKVIDIVRKLSEYAKEYGHSIESLALSWVLRRKEITSIVVGIRNEKQLKNNAESIQWEFSKTQLEEIDGIIGDLNEFNDISLGSF